MGINEQYYQNNDLTSNNSMLYLLKRLLIVLFLINTFSYQAFSENNKNASLLILDKSSVQNMKLIFQKKFNFVIFLLN